MQAVKFYLKKLAKLKKQKPIKIIQKYLTKNKYSRPGRHLENVKGIVIHWVENPKTSALFNWRYFENRKGGEYGYGSAHYIIDLDGTIYQAIPENEMAYHVGAKNYKSIALKKLSRYPNDCTIGIELTHPTQSGKFTKKTYDAAVKLTAYLCNNYNLSKNDIYRHYDITGKKCPKFFVDYPKEFEKFKGSVAKLLCQ